MAASRCRHHGCSITPQTDKYEGYCYKHRTHASNAYKLSPGNVLTSSELGSMMSPPGLSTSGSEGSSRNGANIINSATGMDPDDALTLMRSTSKMSSANGDMRIPSVADSVQHPARELRDIMVEEGMEPSRMRLETFQGANRMTMSGRKNRSSKARHEVLVIDPGTDKEKVVDPSISRFAPLRDRSSEVDDELPSGVTPFGDYPWVGTRDQYRDGSFLWWDQDGES